MFVGNYSWPTGGLVLLEIVLYGVSTVDCVVIRDFNTNQ